jgi:hypothetical protein
MFPVRYELGFISQKTTFFIVTAVKNLKSYIALTGWAMERRSNVSPVKYELSFYIAFHSHLRNNLRSQICIGLVGPNKEKRNRERER